MDAQFHYDPANYDEQVARIAEHVVSHDHSIPTIAPRTVAETNSYHGAAIDNAERDRVSRLYPRLHL